MKAKKSKKTKAIKQEQAKKAFDAAELLPDDMGALGAPSSEPVVEVPAPQAAIVPEDSSSKKSTKSSAAKAGDAKKKGGRPPMTAEEKAANAKARKEAKEKEANMRPTLMLQFAGDEVDLSSVVETAKADFKASHKRTPLTELTLYIKPEDHAAYYVANGSVSGKVSL